MELRNLRRIWSNRWLVLVSAIWVLSCSGVGYVFGSISPIIKSSLRYNQKQINTLGVAEDIGDSLGLIGASLSDILPGWGIMILGALQNFIGYGWLWLLVCHRVPKIPFWMVCLIIGVGTNGETCFITVALVSCVGNFPKNRGPVVGILKGFAGLCGAILTQIYAAVYAPDRAAFIFMVAVGPSMVAIAMMFILRPVGGRKENDPSDNTKFNFLYGVCLLLASYLMGIIIVQDLVEVKPMVTSIFTIVLIIILILPLALPLQTAFEGSPPPADIPSPVKQSSLEAPLLDNSKNVRTSVPYRGQGFPNQGLTVNWNEVLLSELEDEKPKEVDLLPEWERRKRIAHLQARLLHAAAEGAVRIKRRKGPRRGEDFTLMQALIKADFWLMFLSLLFASGSGMTVIDNLGQMSQSMGYSNSHIFVSMLSIWNFLGRVGGGFVSEIVARDYAYPRPAAMVAAQIVMAIGHFFLAMAWPGSLYVGTLLVGLGYGAHWAIAPSAVSEIFGLKNFGALYNFLIMSTPAGSLIFSGLIAGTLYDREAQKQHPTLDSSSGSFLDVGHASLQRDDTLECHGRSCFFLTYLVMVGVCIAAVVLSAILVYRTRIVYRSIYGRNLNSEESPLREEVKNLKERQEQGASSSN